MTTCTVHFRHNTPETLRASIDRLIDRIEERGDVLIGETYSREGADYCARVTYQRQPIERDEE